MHTSASLNTNAIWQNTIGHDPYAAEGEEGGGGGGEANESGYDQFKGLLKLASAQYGTEERGLWKGKKPLKGVFAMPQYGHSEGVKMGMIEEGRTEGGPLSSSSSESSDSSGSDSSDSDSEVDIVKKMSDKMKEGGVMGFGSQKLDASGKPIDNKRKREDRGEEERNQDEEDRRAKKRDKKDKKKNKKKEKKKVSF
jgi:hypothetical protein